MPSCTTIQEDKCPLFVQAPGHPDPQRDKENGGALGDEDKIVGLVWNAQVVDGKVDEGGSQDAGRGPASQIEPHDHPEGTIGQRCCQCAVLCLIAGNVQ